MTEARNDGSVGRQEGEVYIEIRDVEGNIIHKGKAVRVELYPDGDLWIGSRIPGASPEAGIAFLKYNGDTHYELKVFEGDNGKE